MARIAGVNIPSEKRIEISLQYIYGIGPARAKEILAKTKIDPTIRTKNLTEPEINKLREVVEKDFNIEGDLRRQITMNVNRLKEINAYRGIRHKLGLPVRGQRTKTNARTKKGKKVTMGSGRKKSAEKT